MQDTIGKLTLVEPDLIESLARLAAPIATTNYDILISRHTGRQRITWKDREWLLQFHRGEISAVLHLHGSFDQADTIVFGIRSYDDVVKDQTIQDILRSLFIAKTLV